MNTRKNALEYLKTIENDLDKKIHSLECINEQYRLAKKYVNYMQKEQHICDTMKQMRVKSNSTILSNSSTVSSNSLSKSEVNKDIISNSSGVSNDLGLSINVDDLLLKAKSMKFVDIDDSISINTSRSDSGGIGSGMKGKAVGGVGGAGTNMKTNSKSTNSNRSISISGNKDKKISANSNSKKNTLNMKTNTNSQAQSKKLSTSVGIMKETRKVESKPNRNLNSITSTINTNTTPNSDSNSIPISNVSNTVQEEVEETYDLMGITEQMECVNCLLAQYCSKSEDSVTLNMNVKLYNYKYAYHPPYNQSTSSGATVPDGRKYPIVDIPRNYSPCTVRYNQLNPMYSTMNNARLNAAYTNLDFLEKTRNIGITTSNNNANKLTPTCVDAISNPLKLKLKLEHLHVCPPLFLFLQHRYCEQTGDDPMPTLSTELNHEECCNPGSPLLPVHNSDSELQKRDTHDFIYFVLGESKRIYKLLLEIVQPRTQKQNSNSNSDASGSNSSNFSSNRNHHPIGYRKVQDMVSYWCMLNLYNQILVVFLLLNQGLDTADGIGSIGDDVKDSEYPFVAIDKEINGLLALPLFSPGTSATQVEYLVNSTGTTGNVNGNSSRNNIEHILKEYCKAYHLEIKNKYTATLQMLIGKLCVKPLITEIKNTCMMKPSDESSSVHHYRQNWIGVLKKFKLLRMCFSDTPVYFTNK